MEHKKYEIKINDVIMKCPIETGVEILVYNVLDEIIEPKGFALVDINRIRKDRDKRLVTNGGVPDIAVLSSDFEYKTNKGQVYGFIEVKAPHEPLDEENDQITGQKASKKHFIYTNGLIWKYYKDHILEWEVILDRNKNTTIKKSQVIIDKIYFQDLINKLRRIDWC